MRARWTLLIAVVALGVVAGACEVPMPVVLLDPVTKEVLVDPATNKPVRNDFMPIWEPNPGADYAVETVPLYSETDAASLGVALTSDQLGLDATVFRPTTPEPMDGRPAIVYLHGGGWFKQKDPTFRISDRMELAEGTLFQVGRAILSQVRRGYVVISIDYRLSLKYLAGTTPTVPANVNQATGVIENQPWYAALEDAKRGVKLAQETEDIDPTRVVIAGSSAGGNLAEMVAVTPGLFLQDGLGSDSVRGVVNLDGPSNLENLNDAGTTLNVDADAALYFNTSAVPFSQVLSLYLGCSSSCTDKINDASPIKRLDGIDATAVPPVYLACASGVLAGAPLPPKLGCNGRDTAADLRTDATEFHRVLTTRSNDTSRVYLDRTLGNHLTIDSQLNFAFLNGFIDCSVQLSPGITKVKSVTAGAGTATVTWNAPGCNGNEYLTYKVMTRLANGNEVESPCVDHDGPVTSPQHRNDTELSCKLSLAPGNYGVRLIAHNNSHGDSTMLDVPTNFTVA